MKHLLIASALTLALGAPTLAQPVQQPSTLPLPLQKNQTVYLQMPQTPAPPDTIPVAQPDFDYFAWNSFIALNWPAKCRWFTS